MGASDMSKLGLTTLLLGAITAALPGCSAGGASGTGTPSVTEPVTGPAEPVPGGGTSVPPSAVGGAASEPPAAQNPAGSAGLLDPEDIPVGTQSAEPALVLQHRGLLEKQVSCADGATTSVSGTVYIPSGQLPLYNVMVYVPETELAPLTPGASCSCEISGEPITSALTDASGHFVLENVPVGVNIPLVIQVGDWRRELDIGTVAPCVATQVPDGKLTLPKSQREGDMPKIAVATGIADALECLVRKLGVDESEFTNPRDGGRVNLYQGDAGTGQYIKGLNKGEVFPPAEALWDDVNSLKAYDIVLLSCEGDEGFVENKPPEALQAMYEYANLGGRVFASHFHGVWFQEGPGLFPKIATFTNANDSAYSKITGQVVTDFPKGQALAEWIVNSGESADGQVPINGGSHTIVQENPLYAQRWLETTAPDSVQYISANTPLGASDAEQCGRVVLSDLHVSPGPPDSDYSGAYTEFPEGCITDTLTAQEAVLAFMLFDLSACIVPDDQAPVAAPVTIR
jgi:hypothetical protein